MIPRRFHFLWLGPKPMPLEYADCIHAWATMHPGWKVDVWHEHTLPPLVNQRLYDWLGHSGNTVPPRSFVKMEPAVALAVQRADLVGYELVHRFGGVYLNCDMRPLKRIGPLLRGRSAFCAMEDEHYLVNNAMGAEPGHPFFAAVIETLPRRVRAMPGATFEQQTGAHLLTHVYARRPDLGIDTLPAETFNPVHFSAVPPGGSAFDGFDPAKHPDSYAVHGWGHRRGM